MARAKQIGDKIESSGGAQFSTVSSTNTYSTTTTLPYGPSSTPTPGNRSSGSQKTRTVILVGVIVGAVLCIGVIIAGTIAIRASRRNVPAPAMNVKSGNPSTNDKAYARLTDSQRGWMEWNGNGDHSGGEDARRRNQSTSRTSDGADYWRSGNIVVPRIREPTPRRQSGIAQGVRVDMTVDPFESESHGFRGPQR